jgi:hypothetical protein
MPKSCKPHFRISITAKFIMKLCGSGKRACAQLYGTWEDNFQLLFRLKEVVLEVTPDLVIEIEIVQEEGQLFFRRFFCAFGPCLKGFCEGCRPYLSVDSTALNGRWNEHLPSAIGVDDHN